MSAFFDTNIVIDLLAGHPAALAEASAHQNVGISRNTWMEVLISAPDLVTQSTWEAFLGQFDLVELDELVCREAIRLRQQHRLKLPDALIWASAQAYGTDLITRNTKDFKLGEPGVRVPYIR